MNILFEIPDIAVAIICIIFVLLIIVAALIIKHSSKRVLPISEDDRYDNDEIHVTEITKDATDEQREAKEELAKVFSRMSADLEKQKEASDAIDEFEKEQEENAIISYKELLEHAEKLKANSIYYEKDAEEKADINIKDASVTYENHDDYKKSAAKRAFKSSEIVSPIYGIQSNKNMVRQKKSSKSENHDIISKAYQQDLFEEEKTQNLDFLNSLKEFRKNL